MTDIRIALYFGLDGLSYVVRSRSHEDFDSSRLKNPSVCLRVPVRKFAYREFESDRLCLSGLEGDSVECLKLL